MTGSAKKTTEREAILKAMETPPPGGYFEWDGKDEDERPATAQEMQAGIQAERKARGRPAGSGTKEQVAIRFDSDVLAAFRASGPGWQTRMNAALREWVKSHPVP
ncbi:BrnA antitoxin family protein [Thauera butanivorans]|uniref:BrnA antitoxin family protein n=1 Tax=Thauera butanivorans TaxID=86174 RepID=UPI000A025B93|nr:BrnA antitoxin family protein [Thauera butanivorans]